MAKKTKTDLEDLQAAHDELQAMLPHIAHLGSSGQMQAHDLSVRARRLLKPEPAADVVREIRSLVGELRRVVDSQRARSAEIDAERQNQINTAAQLKADAAARKEAARLERIRLVASGY